MEPEILKKEMKKMWKETFKDSDSYIDLIFDSYFDPLFVEYKEIDGQLVSCLLGVPYAFGNSKNHLKALYLCGLNTRPEYRRNGFMRQLYKRIRKRALLAGYDLIFLIPANDGLRRFYRDFGMCDSFYHVENRYTSAHDFDRDYLNFLEKENNRVKALKYRYWESLIPGMLNRNNENEIESLIDFWSNMQKENPFGLIHSYKDMKIVIKENEISNGEISIVRNTSGIITGVAFISSDEENVRIQKLYASDRCSHYRLLSYIKKKEMDKGIVLVQLPDEIKRMALWDEIYPTNLPGAAQVGAIGEATRIYSAASNAVSSGMIEILNIREILKFLTKIRNDCKYSILVKDEESGEILKFVGEKGKVSENKVLVKSKNQDTKSNTISEALSIKNLTEILCRKPDKDKILMEVFGLPRLCLNMALMLE